jgi:poly(3-hydroxybutyrate) depolymerase
MVNILKGKVLYFLPLFVMLAFSCSRLMNRGVLGKNPNNRQVNKPNNPARNNGNNTTRYSTGNFKGKLTKNVIYSTAENINHNKEQLSMDVYEPANAEGKKFPLIIFMHGGNFRTGDKTELAYMSAGLADNGYVCVSINYRVGWGTGSPNNPCNGDTQQLKKAVYMAIQDAHTALRYLASHADEYSIDKNWVFVGGQSAGAIAALCTAYLSQKNANDYFSNVSSDLGDIDAGAGSSYKLRGVISMWGALINPNVITASTALPTIFFQGAKDPVVPFKSAHITRCASSTLLYGTYPLYNRLKVLNETAIAHVDPNGGHGVFTNDFRIKNILCFLNDVKQGVTKQEYLSGEQSSCN